MIKVTGGDGYNYKVAVFGGNGFIGHHLCRRLKSMGYYVLSVDIKECEYGNDHATDILIGDLRDSKLVDQVVRNLDEVWQLGADMGGCQYVFTGEHDADIMRNSAQINFNLCDSLVRINPTCKIFYSSSACMYPQELQNEHYHRGLKESMAYPLNPDSDYGLEKAFSERLYLAYARNYGLNVRIARYHNIYGEEGVYKGGKEKAPASISRKVAEGNAKMWGDGSQTRSFLYIEDCLDASVLLMESNFKEPINIGSEYSVTIKQLWQIVIDISGKDLQLESIKMPPKVMGVYERSSDNTLIREVLGWEQKYTLPEGLERTYYWIQKQINGL